MHNFFTPGPWIAKPDPNSITTGDWCIGIEGSIDKVAVCSVCDARLIAAAPDLLDALKELLDREWQDDEGDYTLEMARRKARAAITKAIG